MKKILTGTLALMLFVGAAQAQTKDSSRHHQGQGREMGKDLNLTADQKAQLKTLHEAQRKEMETLKNTSLTADQAKSQREALRNKYEAQEQAIYTPQQKEKIAQWKSKAKQGKQEGKGRKEWKNKAGKKGADLSQLNLSQDQKDRMAKLRSESKSKMEALRNDKTLGEDQKKARVKELRTAQHEQMKSILTQEQLEKMQSLRKDHKTRTTK